MNSNSFVFGRIKNWAVMVLGLQLLAVTSGIAQTSSTTSLVSSLNPASEGQLITFTATVSGSAPTGAVAFKNGTNTLATITLTNGLASWTTSAGAGTYSITAAYGGDVNDLASVSGVVTEVVTNYSGFLAAKMEDGNDYALTNGTPAGFRGPWYVSSSTTSAIGIVANDLTNATVPDVKPIANVTNTGGSHLKFNLSGAAARQYHRPINASYSNGAVYFSMVMGVTSNANTDQFIFTMLATGASNAPAATDPLSLHERQGSDSTHYNLGIERLNGTVAWATNNLLGSSAFSNYFVVVKYSFGGNCALYINPVPGQPEPTPAAIATGGSTAEPTDIGRIMFSESGSTRGTNHYDLFRADNNWNSVTPSILGAASVPTKIAFSSASQLINAGSSSSLMTVSILDQTGNPLTNSTSPIVINLASSSAGGEFLSSADDATVITNVTMGAGTGMATFYYSDSAIGSPTLTVSSGLLTSGTQTESVTSGCTPPVAYAVGGGGAYCSGGTGADVYLANSQTGASYQLYSNAIAIGGALAGNGGTLDFGGQFVGVYTVSAYVTANPVCSAAMNGSVTVVANYPATVGTSPTNKAVYAGQSASFTASAGMTTSPTYQWQVSTNGGTTWINASSGVGGNSNVYTLPTTAPTDNGSQFRCVVTGSGICGTTTATSAVANLTVTKPVAVTTLISSANPANAGQSITFTASVTSAGTAPTGAVVFKSGSAAIGTSALNGGTASLTLSGGAGTNAITAVYQGDVNTVGSTSAPLSEIIIGGRPVAGTPLMQDGFDYGLVGTSPGMPIGNPVSGLGVWQCSSDLSSNAAVTGHVLILAGDLDLTNSPDLKPLPNQSTNVAAHLQISKNATDREFLRSVGTSVTNGSVYFSLLLNSTVSPTTTGAPMASLLAANSNNAPTGIDPFTLYGRAGMASNSYNLGIQRLGGMIVWATNSLIGGTAAQTYLVVLKYSFASNCQIFINPTPGASEPTASATTDFGGVDPANIGTILFYESGTPLPLSDGTFNYDVMRFDTNWYNVTPPTGANGLQPSVLTFLTTPQTVLVGSNSTLMTIQLLDQSSNIYTVTSNLVINLGSSSTGGTFISASDSVTAITNVTINAGTSTASFYYSDTIAGFPTITTSSGLLTAASQGETINLEAGIVDHFTVVPAVTNVVAGGTFLVTVQAYDTNNLPITNTSLNGFTVTLFSSGMAQFDGNGDGVYGDNLATVTNGTFTVSVRDTKAETITITAALGTYNGVSIPVTIQPGIANSLQVLLPGEIAAPGTTGGKTGSPTVQSAGVPFSITVREVDTNWNVVASSDVIHVTQTGDTATVLPPDTGLSGGVVLLSVTNVNAGTNYTLTATDVTHGAISANSSASYAVSVGPVAHLVLIAPGETANLGVAPGKSGVPTTEIQGAPYSVTIIGVDVGWHQSTGAADAITITSSDSLAGLPASVSLSQGIATVSVTNNSSGTISLTAADATTPAATSGSSTIIVNPTAKYRSVQNGNWEDTNTWQISYDGMSWAAATSVPNYLNADTIAITNGYIVTITAAETIDQTLVCSNSTLVVSTSGAVTVNDGQGNDLDVIGTLVNAGSITTNGAPVIFFEAGGFYVHNFTNAVGVIPLAIWNSNSTCEVVGNVAQTTAPTNIRQSFYNFIWNCTNQTADVSLAAALKTISGNLTILSTGASGRLLLGKSGILATDTLDIYGDLQVKGGTFVGILTSGGPITVGIGGDLLITGGTFDLADTAGTALVVNASNNVSVTGGTLTSGTSVGGVINFAKAGNQKFTNGGTVSGYVAWTVNSNSLLDLNTSSLGGSGTFTTLAGSGLITAHSNGFKGNLNFATSNVFLGAGGNYFYDGLVAQSGDSLLPAVVSGLSVSNVMGLTLSRDETVTNLIIDGFLAGSNISIGNNGSLTAVGPSLVSGNISLGSGTFDLISTTNSLPGLTFGNGSFVLGGGQVTFTVEGAALNQGDYVLLNAGNGGSITGAVPQLAMVNGAGMNGNLAAHLYLTNSQLHLTNPGLYPFADSAAGFFSGVNLWFTNVSGISMFTWSATNTSLSITNWNLEGAMQEQPLNDGSGQSRYSINVNPTVSPTYNLAGTTVLGPYLSPVPVAIVTTADFANFTLQVSNFNIGANGVLAVGSSGSGPLLTNPHVVAGGTFGFQFTGPVGQNYAILVSSNLINWVTLTNGTISSSPVLINDSTATNYSKRFYKVSF